MERAYIMYTYYIADELNLYKLRQRYYINFLLDKLYNYSRNSLFDVDKRAGNCDEMHS